jgi:hypothetical protein
MTDAIAVPINLFDNKRQLTERGAARTREISWRVVTWDGLTLPWSRRSS